MADQKDIEFLDYATEQPKTSFDFINPLVKGLPSVTVQIWVKNNTIDKTRRGFLITAPGSDQSFSADLQLALAGQTGQTVWSNQIPLTIAPGHSVAVKIRVMSLTTPENSRGTASIKFPGVWETVNEEIQ